MAQVVQLGSTDVLSSQSLSQYKLFNSACMDQNLALFTSNFSRDKKTTLDLADVVIGNLDESLKPMVSSKTNRTFILLNRNEDCKWKENYQKYMEIQLAIRANEKLLRSKALFNCNDKNNRILSHELNSRKNKILDVNGASKMRNIEVSKPKKDMLCIGFHDHSENQNGLLQLCSGDHKMVRTYKESGIREMEKVFLNRKVNAYKDVMDSTCKLELPGPYDMSLKPRELKLKSNRYNLDELGLMVLLVDTIYAFDVVVYGSLGNAKIPKEFTQDIVKVVALMKSGFPSLFENLQKLVMYSTLISVLRKPPFEWNKFMVQVLEDLIVHPLPYVEEMSVEFQLLLSITQRRAKILFKLYEFESEMELRKLSHEHRRYISSRYTKLSMPEIKQFLAASAITCVSWHRVKNIRFITKDQKLKRILETICESYC